MALAFALPLVLLVSESFAGAGRARRSTGYRKVLGDPYYVGIIWNSIQLALITTLGTLSSATRPPSRSRAPAARCR